MRKIFPFQTTSSWPSLNKRNNIMRGVWLWRVLRQKLRSAFCPNFLSQEELKCLIPLTASRSLVNWELIFCALPNCYIQMWFFGYNKSEADLIFTWLATTPTVNLGFLIAHFPLVVLFSRMIIKWNEWTCLDKLLSIKTTWMLYHRLWLFWKITPVHPRTLFFQCCASWDCYWNE